MFFWTLRKFDRCSECYRQVYKQESFVYLTIKIECEETVLSFN